MKSMIFMDFVIAILAVSWLVIIVHTPLHYTFRKTGRTRPLPHLYCYSYRRQPCSSPAPPQALQLPGTMGREGGGRGRGGWGGGVEKTIMHPRHFWSWKPRKFRRSEVWTRHGSMQWQLLRHPPQSQPEPGAGKGRGELVPGTVREVRQQQLHGVPGEVFLLFCDRSSAIEITEQCLPVSTQRQRFRPWGDVPDRIRIWFGEYQRSKYMASQLEFVAYFLPKTKKI